MSGYHERMSGVWPVIIAFFAAAVVLLVVCGVAMRATRRYLARAVRTQGIVISSVRGLNGQRTTVEYQGRQGRECFLDTTPSVVGREVEVIYDPNRDPWAPQLATPARIWFVPRLLGGLAALFGVLATLLLLGSLLAR